MSMSTLSPASIHATVREHYGEIARTRDTSTECCGPDACGCGSDLYSSGLIAELPSSVTELSLGCGDPVSLADIRPGDTVLDLGSGGGIDCFLAAKRAGPAGRVIGVDMTPEMLARARANAAKLNAANVEFRQGQIEDLPVEDESADVILSNCVINLSPDKPRVFREMFRTLRPGGRISVSDIVTKGPMSPMVAQDAESWSACVSGALDVQTYAEGLRVAGFADVRITPREDLTNSALSGIPAGTPFSALITARKPDTR
jgi:SAM-dependent methyltransferase